MSFTMSSSSETPFQVSVVFAYSDQRLVGCTPPQTPGVVAARPCAHLLVSCRPRGHSATSELRQHILDAVDPTPPPQAARRHVRRPHPRRAQLPHACLPGPSHQPFWLAPCQTCCDRLLLFLDLGLVFLAHGKSSSIRASCCAYLTPSTLLARLCETAIACAPIPIP